VDNSIEKRQGYPSSLKDPSVGRPDPKMHAHSSSQASSWQCHGRQRYLEQVFQLIRLLGSDCPSQVDNMRIQLPTADLVWILCRHESPYEKDFRQAPKPA
jgi:hypothetical protein